MKPVYQPQNTWLHYPEPNKGDYKSAKSPSSKPPPFSEFSSSHSSTFYSSKDDQKNKPVTRQALENKIEDMEAIIRKNMNK